MVAIVVQISSARTFAVLADPAEKPLGAAGDKNVALTFGDDKVAAGLLPEGNWSGSKCDMRFYAHTSLSASSQLQE